MTFSSELPPAPTHKPHDEIMWDRLSAAQQRKLGLGMLAYIKRWQGAAHLVHCFPVLEQVIEEAPRSPGFPVDFVPTSDVLPHHDNRASVTLGSPSPHSVNPLVWK